MTSRSCRSSVVNLKLALVVLLALVAAPATRTRAQNAAATFALEEATVEQMQPSSLRAGTTMESNESGRGWGGGEVMRQRTGPASRDGCPRAERSHPGCHPAT